MALKESILDFPKDTLNPSIWTQLDDGTYALREDVEDVVEKIASWARQAFKIPEMSVHLTGSNTSNSYSSSSDLDIHFSSPKFKKDKADEFNNILRKKFEELVAQHPELGEVNGVKTEVYMQPNLYQDMMSVGCYDFSNHKWLVGPELKDTSFDPYAEYFTKDMKNVDDVIDDVRSTIFKVYELAIALIKTNDYEFKEKLAKKLKPLVSKAAKIYAELRAKRQHKSSPKSSEEALQSRDDKDWKIADSTFKLLDKFGYLGILKGCSQSLDRFDEDMSDIEMAMKDVIATIGEKISVHALDDSEQEFANMLLELDQQNESFSSMMKLSAIASLMAISSFLPANALAKELGKAKQAAAMQGQKFTKDSPQVKKAIANATKENAMVGPMSKANTVNALAQVLWKEARGEGEDGIKAVASVIFNRSGGDPQWMIDVIKMRKQFSCLNDYIGGWTDATYRWFNPSLSQLKDAKNQEIWEFCKNIALQLVDKNFKSTIGNRNVYANPAKADKKNVESWIKDCDLQIGKHKFGYRQEYNPSFVKPGTFTLWKTINRTSSKPMVVTVKRGDTLGKIAKNNNTSVATMMKLNPSLKDPGKISVGQKLRVA